MTLINALTTRFPPHKFATHPRSTYSDSIPYGTWCELLDSIGEALYVTLCILAPGPALGFARPKAAAICEALSSLPFHLLPSPLPFSSPHLPSLIPSLPFPFSLPLEVGPLDAARGLVERCKLRNGVWGKAPAEIEFGAFYPYNMIFGSSNNY